MGKKQISTKLVVQYEGHNFKKDGSLDLNFKADYSEIVNVMSLFRMLNQNITIQAKIGREKPEALGVFSIKAINVDRDGESKIRFTSEVVNINPDKLTDLMTPETLIVLKASASVDSEEDDEDEDE
jgi:acetylglutamate kinase